MTSPTFPTQSGPLTLAGPAGALEAAIDLPDADVPALPLVAVVCHPLPTEGGTMHNKVVTMVARALRELGATTLRFNFRGVGKSQGTFDNGVGELSDAASALDWVQSFHPEAQTTWIAGFSFGAWIGMQLLMRRPEIRGFISIAAMANRYDFTFLAPCPSSGLFVHGSEDRVAPAREVMPVIEKVKVQKGVIIEHQMVEGANHFFDGKVDELTQTVDTYLDKRLGPAKAA